MQLIDILKKTNFEFESGGKYQWRCFGPNAVFYDFKEAWQGFDVKQEQRPVGGAVVDANTGLVYEATVELPGQALCYRWVEPDFVDDMKAESKSRGVDKNVAWDDVNFTDLEVEADFLDKFDAIVHRRDFDRGILVPLHMTEEEELQMHRLAHEAGMSTNDYVNQILANEVARVHGMTKKELKKERKRAKRIVAERGW